MHGNPILTSANAFLGLTNYAGNTASAVRILDGLPLGTADGSATAELGVKVVLVGGTFPAVTIGAVTQSGTWTVTATPPSVTNHIALLGASATQAIPTGAKGYFWAVLTGTATVNGIASIPAGASIGDANTLAAGFSVVTASASSALVSWNT